MESKHPFQVSVGLIEIKENSFFIKHSDNKKPVITGKVEFKTGVQINKEEEKIHFVLIISIFGNGTDPKEYCNLNLQFTFHAIGLKRSEIKKNNKIFLPDSFMEMITNISVSTARGILYEKLSRSSLKDFILPIMDIKDLVPFNPERKKKIKATQ